MAYGLKACSCHPLNLKQKVSTDAEDSQSQVCLWYCIVNTINLIETLYRENDSFQDRDFIRVTQCQIASKFSDAELLQNIRVSI